MSKFIWNLHRQAEIAKNSFNSRPDWAKSISYFCGTNTVSPAITTKNGLDIDAARAVLLAAIRAYGEG